MQLSRKKGDGKSVAARCLIAMLTGSTINQKQIPGQSFKCLTNVRLFMIKGIVKALSHSSE